MEKKALLNSTIISAYLLFVSVSYLWGFWGHFDINILNYIGVSDIIKSAMWPMIIATVLYFTQVAINNFNGPKPNSSVKYADMAKPERVDFIIRHSYLLIMLCIAISGVIYTAITGGKMLRYACIGWVLATVVYFKTCKNQEIMEFIPFKNKPFYFSVICLLPALFLTRGVIEGDKIIAGKDTFIVESKELCPDGATNKYRYIDVMADKAFALSLKDNSICIFKFNHLKLVKESSSKINK